MNPEDLLNDELEHLQGLLKFFQQTKYEIMEYNIAKRIDIVQNKLEKLLNLQSEIIY